MSKVRTDPLLLAAKIVVGLGIGLLTFASVMVGIGVVAVLTVQRAEILAKAAEAGAPGSAYPAVVVALLLIGGLLALGAWFLKSLYDIVQSVDRGDPFAAENGDRLARMGWITVAAQVMAVIVGSIAAWLQPYAEKIGADFTTTGDFGGGGLLLTLVLFVLARVFRQGAAMREELEGTV